MKKILSLSTLVTLSSPCFAALVATDITDQVGGDTEIWNSAALTSEVGQAIDDTYNGQITVSFDLNVSATTGGYFGFVQFKNAGADETGIGSKWAGGTWTTWNEAGTGGDGSINFGDAITLGSPTSWTMVIDFNAGADDTATITGPGLAAAAMDTGDYSFDQVTFRTGAGATFDVANLNLAATTAVPEPSSSALLGLGGLALILRRRK